MAKGPLGLITLFFLRIVGWGVFLLPDPIRVGLGNGFGRLVRLLGYRSTVIRENLERAYPGNDKAELRDRLYDQSFLHIGQLFIEILMVFGPWRRFLEKRAVLRGKETYLATEAAGRPVIYLAGHIGNWELMVSGVALRGLKALMVTKHLKPEWFHKAFEKGRSSCDVMATYEPHTMKDILKRLRSGRSVGVILDQYAGPPIGLRVPFFGVPVGTSSAIAAIVKRTGAVIHPAIAFWEDGKFVTEIRDAVEWIEDSNPARELALNTAHYSAIVEGMIRERPATWLWTHRRFKGDLSPIKPGEWDAPRGR